MSAILNEYKTFQFTLILQSRCGYSSYVIGLDHKYQR